MRKRHKGHYDAERHGVRFEAIRFHVGEWKLWVGACEVLAAPTKEACVDHLNGLTEAECKALQANSDAIRAGHASDELPF